jgi:hypothetical protein
MTRGKMITRYYLIMQEKLMKNKSEKEAQTLVKTNNWKLALSLSNSSTL